MRLRVATLDEKFEVEVEPFWPISRLNDILQERVAGQASHVKQQEWSEDDSRNSGRKPFGRMVSLDGAEAKATSKKTKNDDDSGDDDVSKRNRSASGDIEDGNSGSETKIRLVYQGQLLDDFDLQIGEAGLTEGNVLHCMVSKVPLISRKSQESTTTSHSHRGFSLLDSAGYTFEEIEAIRLTYFPYVVEFARTQPLVPGEDPHDRWNRLEEEWMLQQSMNPNSEFSRNARAYASHIRMNHSTKIEAPATDTGNLANMRRADMPDGFPSPHVPQQQSRSLETQLEDLRRTYTSAQIEQQLQQRVATLRLGTNAPSLNGLRTRNNGNGRMTLDIESPAPEGSIGHFCLGFILGFLLGIIMVFWLWERRLPRRQKMGILVGMSLNLILQFYGVENEKGVAKNGDNNLRGSLAGGIKNQTMLSVRDGIKPADQLYPLSALNDGSSTSKSISDGEIILG